MTITDRNIDRIGSLIVDLRQELMRAGLRPQLRILVRQDEQAELARALSATGSRWADRRSADGALRFAGAVIAVGG